MHVKSQVKYSIMASRLDGPVTESIEAALVEGIMEELRKNSVTDTTDTRYTFTFIQL